MPYQYLLYEKQRQGVLITLNRPEQLNAFNDGLRQELEGPAGPTLTDVCVAPGS